MGPKKSGAKGGAGKGGDGEAKGKEAKGGSAVKVCIQTIHRCSHVKNNQKCMF
jgi:hypothetical protein